MKLFFPPFLCLLCILWTPVLSARNIVFEHISIDEGLSQSIVECITQDSRGFMWFGTEDGLNKYDGYKFTVSRNDPLNPNSLSHSNIMTIYEDGKGVIWIGTFHGGLTRYDPAEEKYTRYRKNPDTSKGPGSDVVRSICEYPEGVLWIGTDDGLNRFDTASGVFTLYKSEPGGLSHNAVYSICKGSPGVIWIGTHGGGLNKFDTVSNKFTYYKARPGDTSGPGSNEINRLYIDSSGFLWIGTDGAGLDKFDTENEIFTHYRADPEVPGSLSSSVVKAIARDRSGTLWVGTADGLNTMERDSETFSIYRNDPNNLSSLNHNEIHSLHVDTSGIIWIGTYGGGINKYNPGRKNFLHYKSNPNNPNSLSHDIVWSICEDRSGMLWIGTHAGGLNKFDRKTGRFYAYRADPKNPHALNSDSVRLVYEDASGLLWIGTNGGGVNTFDTKTEFFAHYINDPKKPDSLSHNDIRAIYEDRSGVLWIGTHGGGLDRFNRETGTFTRFQAEDNDLGSLSNDVVRAIYQDEKGTLWVGTYGGGLNKFHPETGKFTHYRANPENPECLSNDYIFVIHEDKSHYLWIGTWGGGLNRFDPKKGTFSHYGAADGLPSDSIYGILEDDGGNLWLSSNNGLSRFNPIRRKFRNYHEADGLQSNEFNGGAFYKSREGEMYFGGIKGFNAFFPKAIKDNNHIPPIVITSFQKLNKAVKLHRSITAIKELTLSYKDYFFSFEFAALDFAAPRENEYAYKMEGLDEDWIYTDSDRRFAVYTTLAPGRYTFRVKGSNNDGIWNGTGTSIEITITPPPWKTWWFQGSAAVLVLFLSWVLYKRRMKNFFFRTRMETELQTAHDAQMSIMPQEGPQIEGFDVFGICIPASEVGGDFFDYPWMDKENNRFGIAVGDVSGKAMKSAMTAVMANGIIYAKASETYSITEVMAQLNRSLCDKTDKRIFTALLIVSFDTHTREMTYSNAGLPEPLIKSGTTVTRLKSSGTKIPLGIVREKLFLEDTLYLKRGDVLVIFTDGLSESWNSQHELYGTEKLVQFLKELDTPSMSAEKIVKEIMTDIKKFSHDVHQHDDITIAAVKVL